MKLYTYWRSSSAYRVRIALNLKGIVWEPVAVHLVRDGGEHKKPEYLARNAAGLVPALELDDGTVLTQSLAIIDWLESVQPEPALLPAAPLARARVLAMAHIIAMEVQPPSNLGTVQHLKASHGADMQGGIDWMCHFMAKGFDVLEPMVKGPFADGAEPGLADICIVPQLYNAHRWGLDFSPYPKLRALEQACLALPAFADAAPEAQPDAD